MKGRKGITLVELVISMAILGFVISLILLFLNLKVREAVRERSFSFMQSEIQLASEIITWDIWLTGFGLRTNVYPLSQWDSVGINGSDSLVLRATAFITERGKWTYILQKAHNTNTLLVYRWDNPIENIDSTDYIIILMGDKELVAGPLNVSSVKETTYVTVTGENKNALILTLESAVQYVNPGYLVFVVNDPGSTYTEVHYKLTNDEVLLRSGEELLRNVRLFKVDLAVDTSGKGDIAWVSSIPQGWSADHLRDNLKLVQISLIIHSPRKDRSYEYPSENVSVSTPDGSIIHSIDIGGEDRHYRWIPLAITIKPRNLFR
ncbi:MAG TPA: type II secretion system protein [Deltaproteobacteria bacterium]|nr:MAG: hypothetical protein DRQ10_00385 [Candidatus Hydrothermae bacterium]HDM78403.1 type II secretion system protein [Deltaproteobacteria bacterium]